MPFRLQYASNLFVDLHRVSFDTLLRPKAPYLALTGNIGRPWSPKSYSFLKYCSKHWDTVLWVPGPHELTNLSSSRHTASEAVLAMKDLSKQIPGLQILDSKEAVFHSDGVVALGTSLWTHIPPGLTFKGEPEFTSILASVDEAGPIPLTRTIRNTWNKEDHLFLKERSLFWTIVRPDVQLVYLTHTLPTVRLLNPTLRNRTYLRLPLDCNMQTRKPGMRAWIGGATGSTNQLENNSFCVNSLYEYPFTSPSFSNKEYDPECVLEIQPQTPTVLPDLVLPEGGSSLLPRKQLLGLA